MTDPHPHPKFKISDLALTWKDDLAPPPTHPIFQIWPGHGKMTDPPPFSPKNLKFQIWPGHGKMTDPHPYPKSKISHKAPFFITFSLGGFYTKDLLPASVTL